jgi:hypothetical protein
LLQFSAKLRHISPIDKKTDCSIAGNNKKANKSPARFAYTLDFFKPEIIKSTCSLFQKNPAYFRSCNLRCKDMEIKSLSGFPDSISQGESKIIYVKSCSARTTLSGLPTSTSLSPL